MKTKLAIAIPCSFPWVPVAFHEAYTVMKKPVGGYVYIRVKSLHSIEDMRNRAVEEALRLDCTHLLQIDSDMVVHPETIPVLLSREMDIVGALYFNRFPPFEPTAVISDDRFPEWISDDFYEVEKVGGGCLMVNTDVFRCIEPPWFKMDRDAMGKIKLGEDFTFCKKARALGYKIYCDSTVTAQHVSEMFVDGSTRIAYESAI